MVPLDRFEVEDKGAYGIVRNHADLNYSVLNVTLVHIPHWFGVVPLWSVMVLH